MPKTSVPHFHFNAAAPKASDLNTVPLLPSSSAASLLVQHRRALTASLEALEPGWPELEAAGGALVAALRSGHKVLIAGNGGSAAEAQHLAAELVGRFKRDRRPFSVQSLATDSSVLTALGNDYGFSEVFARQVEASGRTGDALVLFSTSGESENLVRAAVQGQAQGMTVIAVTGGARCRLGALADIHLAMPTQSTDTIQELQMLVTHVVAELVETELCPGADR